MNLVLKMMNLALKMMNFGSQMKGVAGSICKREDLYVQALRQVESFALNK